MGIPSWWWCCELRGVLSTLLGAGGGRRGSAPPPKTPWCGAGRAQGCRCHPRVSPQEDAEAVTGRPRSLRFNSLFSEDELIEDYYDAPPAK